MTRRVILPVDADVEQARNAVLAEAAAAGRRPSVVALATRLGLTNATFWRYYPHIAREVAEQRRTAAPSTGTPIPDIGSPTPLTALRRANRELTENLALAVANIQRLSLENEGLRQELEAARKVTRLSPAR